jgi:hypothetical protein
MLPLISRTYAVSADVEGDENDYYRFNLTQMTTVDIHVSHIPAQADYDMWLMHANSLAVIGESRNSENKDEQMTVRLPAGTYYLLVRKLIRVPEADANSYRLAVAFQ